MKRRSVAQTCGRWSEQRGSRWTLRNWQRHPGEDYQLFEVQQLASTPAWPSNSVVTNVYNCPEAGLTMGDCWDRFGMAFDGDLLRATEKVQLEGLVNGYARAGLASTTLGPPRFVVTQPTHREAAKVRVDERGSHSFGCMV